MVVSMDRWKGKVAVVTGASAGIGAEIARALVEAGLKVVGLARRKERVEALAKSLESKPGKLYPFKADMTKESEILAAFEWTKKTLGPISILVNNAGIIRNTNLAEGNTDLWREVFETNVIGLCIATREAIRSMKENKIDGHIIHINSVAGHKVTYFPTLNVYPGSKHAVTALTEALRLELVNTGSRIKITSVSPGAVKTEIIAAGDMPITGETEKLFDGNWLESEDIADAVIYALSTPPHVQIHELTIKPVGEKF